MSPQLLWAGGLLRGTLAAILVLTGLLFVDVSGVSAEQAEGTPVVDPLDPIIDNGSLVQMGINPAGHLNVGGGTPSMPSGSTSYVGLRYIPTNGESTAPGCLCEGWGVANADSATGTFAGYANISSDGGVVGLVVQSGTGVTVPTGKIKPESVGSAFQSIVRTSNGRLEVTHDYHPSSTPNLYQVDVTIKNIGSTTVGDLRYRRVMDWDIAPFTFSEWVEIHVGSATDVLRATSDGFRSGNPLSSPGPYVGSPPTTLVPGSPDYFKGPSDQGALFDFKFGALAPGETKTFKTYYGAAANRTEMLAALGVVGAEVYSFGIPRSSSGAASTTGPHIFAFAFGGVGGTPVVPTDNVAPTTTVAASPGPNANGWNNTDATLTFSATDTAQQGVDPSGVANITVKDNGSPLSCPSGASCTVTLTAEGVHNIQYFATDNAGNVEATKTMVVRIDKTPPTITGSRAPLPNANGWNNTDVTVTFACSDGLSGIDSCGPTPQVVSTEGAGQSRSATAVDKAGNSASATVGGINIDKTAPVIAGLPAAGCTLWPPNHKLVSVATVTASDGGSGLAAAVSVTGLSNEPDNGLGDGDTTGDIVISGGSVQLRAERSGKGTGRTYTLTATVSDLAGNTTTATSGCSVPHDQRK